MDEKKTKAKRATDADVKTTKAIKTTKSAPKKAAAKRKSQSKTAHDIVDVSQNPIAGWEARRDALVVKAKQLFEKHGLKDWQIGFNKNKRRAGVCRYKQRIIELSIEYVARVPREASEDTLLHELAHALVGSERVEIKSGQRKGRFRYEHHGAKWRQMAKDLGCTSERCHYFCFMRPKHVLSCEKGCFRKEYHTRLSKYESVVDACIKCQTRWARRPRAPQTRLAVCAKPDCGGTTKEMPAYFCKTCQGALRFSRNNAVVQTQTQGTQTEEKKS